MTTPKRKRSRWWAIAWLVWLGLFLAVELPAIFNTTDGDTLSEHVWRIVSVPVAWWLLAGFLVWLLVHLLGPQARRWIRSWRK